MDFLKKNILKEAESNDLMKDIYMSLEDINRYDVRDLLFEIMSIENDDSEVVDILQSLVNNYDELLVHLDKTKFWI